MAVTGCNQYLCTGFSHDPADVGNLISSSSAFSKTSLNIREFSIHVLLKPSLENFERYFSEKLIPMLDFETEEEIRWQEL